MKTSQEIERKFLLKYLPDNLENPQKIYQGYISRTPAIRVRQKGEKFYLTVKEVKVFNRMEFETEIDKETFDKLWATTEGSRLEKVRYTLPAGNNLIWEIDVFEGKNKGLLLAEIELPSEDCEFEKTDWLGEEVSYSATYQNINLTS
ncbi:MAG: adenylate cyclase [Calditrichaeota bacterium]|nr:MAG: adenylate cyclase [Calditrichota bacterium]